jgi:DNA-binding CsgD family transcriptional regulator
VGKSRLLHELGVLARTRGALVLSGRAWEVPDGMAYALLAGAVGPHLRGLRGRSRDELLAALPELNSLFVGLGPRDAQPLGSPELEKMRLAEAFCVLVERMAASRPVLLALDDLHCADRASLEMLHYLGRNLSQAAVLVVGTCRSQTPARNHFLETMVASLTAFGVATLMPLSPLGDGPSIDLATSLLGGELSPPLGALIASRARGVPLFVIELVRSLQASGHIVARDGRFTAAEGADAHLPPTIREAVSARLQHLDENDRALLAAIAASGAEVDLGRLVSVCDREPAELTAALERLTRDGWITAGEGHCYDQHPLVRQAVLDGIDAEARRALHLRHLHALEQARDRANGRLLHHYAEAGAAVDTSRALVVVRQAAEQALRLHAHVEARAHYEVTVSLARRLGQPALLAELLEAYGRVCADLGDAAAAVAGFAEAVALYTDLGQGCEAALAGRELALAESRRGRLGEARAALQAAWSSIPDGDGMSRLLLAEAEVLVRQRMGDVNAIEAIADELHRLAESLRRPDVSFTAKQIESSLRLSRLNCPRAYQLAGEALAAARALGQPLLIYRALVDRFLIASSLGDHVAVADQASEACEIARGLRSRPLTGIAELGVLLGDWIRGDFRIAAKRGPELFEAARRSGDVRWSVCAIFAQGMVAAHRGEVAMARMCLAEGTRQAEGAEDDAFVATIRDLFEAELLSVEGQHDAAIERGERACGPVPGRLMKTLYPVYMCLRLGLIYVRAGRLEDARLLAERLERGGPLAEGHAARLRALAGDPRAVYFLEQACARMRGLGMQDHLAACCLDLADALPPERRAEAAELYREALRIGQEMDDPPIVNRARAGLQGLGLPADPAQPRDQRHLLKDLSARESEVAILLAEGESREQVAQRLGVSPHTVATYIKRIYERLGFTSRVQLTRYVLEHQRR